MFTPIILAVIFTFLLLIGITRFAFRNQVTNTITLADMKYCERQIKKKYRIYTDIARKVDNENDIDTIDIPELAEHLNLQMENVPSSFLEKDTRACLDIAIENSGYNGIIRYTSDGDNDYESNFDLIHEIMHYLKDVGAEKKVTKSFARMNHGNRRGYHEQMIDYYAAAVAIPKESLQKRIRSHIGDPYDDCFVEKLTDIYKQPKNMIIRRIGEVEALS